MPCAHYDWIFAKDLVPGHKLVTKTHNGVPVTLREVASIYPMPSPSGTRWHVGFSHSIETLVYAHDEQVLVNAASVMPQARRA